MDGAIVTPGLRQFAVDAAVSPPRPPVSAFTAAVFSGMGAKDLHCSTRIDRRLPILTRKYDLSWARGSRPRRLRAEPGPAGRYGQAAWVWPVRSGWGSGMRHRVTSKPRALSLPTW